MARKTDQFVFPTNHSTVLYSKVKYRRSTYLIVVFFAFHYIHSVFWGTEQGLYSFIASNKKNVFTRKPIRNESILYYSPIPSFLWTKGSLNVVSKSSFSLNIRSMKKTYQIRKYSRFWIYRISLTNFERKKTAIKYFELVHV